MSLINYTRTTLVLLLVISSHAESAIRARPSHYDSTTQTATKEKEFRERDSEIQSQFRDAVKKKREHQWTMKKYSSTVKKLRKNELKLFSAINKHQFSDETEYNYWHRGRMKFPSVLAQEAEWLKHTQGPAPSDNLQP